MKSERVNGEIPKKNAIVENSVLVFGMGENFGNEWWFVVLR